ncbi:MAG: phytase [Acidobacteriota bacterium]
MTVSRRNERKMVASLALVLMTLLSMAVFGQDEKAKDKPKEKKHEKSSKSSSSSSLTQRQNTAPSVSMTAGNTTDPSGRTIESVTASVETHPVPSPGDAADDPAIWVNPNDISQSTIIGTDKRGGLAVYDLSGKELQYLKAGMIDNVDLRAGFKLGGERIALVTGGNRTDNSISIFRVNPQTRQLENVAARTITTMATYGSCMYRNPKTEKVYYFVTGKTGNVEQWELFDNGQGKVDGKKVRAFNVGSVVEGCVADDELGHFYVSEEAVGIWKYGAEPETGQERKQVDKTGPGGHLVADVEGLAIAYGPDGTGFLMASSQGNHTYVVYRREAGHAFVKTFRIIPSESVDGAEETDGIDVLMAPLGPAFPHGVFVAQDGFNDKGNQNFKLVPLDRILGADVLRKHRAGSQ